MSVIEAIILGVIQGLTEFLPVSSSGHLELVQALFGNQNKTEENLIFTIVVMAQLPCNAGCFSCRRLGNHS